MNNPMKKRILVLAGLFVLLAVAPVWAGRAKAKHVVLIALDGWGAYSVPKADIPNIRALMENGCYSLKNRNVMPTVSAPNWASMFMGVGTELHGYTQWGSRKPEVPSRVVNERGIFPTIFSVLREQRPKAETGCLYEWEGIKYLIDHEATSHHAQAPDYKQQPEGLCQMAVDYIKEKKPAFCAVCFDQLDHAGHTSGHDTYNYYICLKQLDGYVGRIVQAVKDAGMLKNTVFIITADHGGKDKGHGGKSLEELEIPFVISGKGIKTTGAFEESMRIYDTASTVAYILGVKQPQVWTGRPVYHVFK